MKVWVITAALLVLGFNAHAEDVKCPSNLSKVLECNNKTEPTSNGFLICKSPFNSLPIFYSKFSYSTLTNEITSGATAIDNASVGSQGYIFEWGRARLEYYPYNHPALAKKNLGEGILNYGNGVPIIHHDCKH